ncbi:hypothetical protein [Elizabethkingia miricola]|uniref:hypothetical protein n=2 Tax=Elizabethkingia miricola TaxID=172045 RepID=UPI000B34D582|nr:hypothetical protein [Elizabethkingia miricola]NHQ67232.1 hypothetical protein [Elizabethkingia miricola]NHQ70162.1 hypothetical protein [Elizabethkingia miricola]UIO98068.1 hypothetical protein LYZ41_08300 [Elizabethkingia miricola]WER14848.1 hypothetical protein P0M31_08265 [Elizabethkingia miricola]WGL75021.1 hypothetical protein QFB80_08230 [Elizabethkingia miricola]
MKKIILFLFSFITVGFSAQAGNENISYSNGFFFMRANRPSNIEYTVDGSPYINGKEYRKVTIEGYSKNVQNLRYNAYEDEMEFMQDGKNYFANKEEGIVIKMPEINKTYKAIKYLYNDKSYFNYLVALSLGSKFNLYKKESIELLKGEKSPSAYGKDANDYFAKAKDLYLIGNKKVLDKFPKTTKEAIALFSPVKNDVAEFIKNQKINVNKEEDMIKLVNFVNQ